MSRDAFTRFGPRILRGDTVGLGLELSLNCVQLPRSLPVVIVERSDEGVGVRMIETGDTAKSVWWIHTAGLVAGAVPDSERVTWPTISTGPRIKRGTVVCTTQEGIQQAANLIAQNDTDNLLSRTPFFCYHIARDDSILEVVVQAAALVAYKGYPRSKPGVTWVREVDALGLDIATTTGGSGDSLSLISFMMTPIAKDPSLEIYSNAVTITLTVKNNTHQPIAAWRATLVVKDPFGEELFRTQVTDGKASIPPGMIADASFKFEDNAFIADEPYDKLMAYEASKLSLRLIDVRLVH